MAAPFPALSAEADAADWVPVRSSNVEAVAYVEAFGRMYLRFKSGERYAYKCPRAVYDGLLAAPSKGQYVFYVVRAKGTDSAFAYWGPL